MLLLSHDTYPDTCTELVLVKQDIGTLHSITSLLNGEEKFLRSSSRAIARSWNIPILVRIHLQIERHSAEESHFSCREHVKPLIAGFKNNCHQAFPTLEEAKAYLREKGVDDFFDVTDSGPEATGHES